MPSALGNPVDDVELIKALELETNNNYVNYIMKLELETVLLHDHSLCK